MTWPEPLGRGKTPERKPWAGSKFRWDDISRAPKFKLNGALPSTIRQSET